MLAKLPQSSLWKRLVHVLSDIAPDIAIKPSQDGCFIQSVDPSLVCVALVNLHDTGMIEYSNKQDEEQAESFFAVSSKSLVASSKSFRDDEELLIDLSNDRDTIVLTSFRDDRIAYFEHPLINTSMIQWLDAQTDYDCIARVTMSSATWMHAIKSLSMLMDTCTIRVEKETMTLCGRNESAKQDIRSSISFSKDECVLDVSQSISISISLVIARRCIDMACLSPTTTLLFADHFPLQIKTSLQDIGQASVFIAPLEQ